jgi:hypothetical protein
MPVSSERVVRRFAGPSPINPVYKSCIENLVSSGLYTSALDYGDAVNPSNEHNILQYKNGLGVPKSAVPLEVLVDSITKAILTNIRDGLAGSVDSAVNINFENTSVDKNLDTINNLHSAIVCLANEIATIRTTLAALLPEPAFSTAVTKANAVILVDDATKHKLS